MTTEPALCYVDGCWAWFTTAPLDEQWGDDWDDAPYGCNAGEPYEWRPDSGVPQYTLTKVAVDAWVLSPHSHLSVRDINTKRLSWATIRGPRGGSVDIFAGTPLSEFKRLVLDLGGTVYLPEVQS